MPHDKSTKAFFLLVLLISLSVRGLTTYFIHSHLSDPGWFQSGTYSHFDTKAQEILDGKSSIFWIDDPSRTESAVYPPGYPLWVALIYKLTGERSAASVQRVQWVLDSLSVFLIVGIAVTAYGWNTAIAAGLLAALSPLLAMSGAIPLADAPTSWLVLGSVWLLVIGVRRQSILLAILAGALVGLSCWFRANALLLPLFWIVAVLLLRMSWRSKVILSGALIVGLGIVVVPLLIRNAVAFRIFTPTGLGMGTNLWEGIGETDRAAEFGAVFGDQNVVEQERIQLGVPHSDGSFSLYYPDGVQRDRERGRKAFAVIRAHPVWYAGVMLRRIAGVLKFAGDPAPYYGSSGINVTSKKSLPERLQGGVLSFLVTALGMVQSVMRYLALPLMVVGIAIALRSDWRLALLLLTTVLYYLFVGSALHTEIRYGLPMQALLFVFAGLSVSKLIAVIHRKSKTTAAA